MKKFIVSLVVVIVAALLGMLGWNIFKGNGPRERISDGKGSKIIVEELSYYIHGDKVFGKVYKPADENGNFPDSLGSRPVVIYFHEPLKTAAPEGTLKALVSKGIIGYLSASDGKGKDLAEIVRKVRKERFSEPDLVFLISDEYSSQTVVNAASKLKKEVAGLILISSPLEGKAEQAVSKLGYEVLRIDQGSGSASIAQITDYLDSKGALK